VFSIGYTFKSFRVACLLVSTGAAVWDCSRLNFVWNPLAGMSGDLGTCFCQQILGFGHSTG